MSGFRVGVTGDFGESQTIGGWLDEPLREILTPLPGLEWSYLPLTAVVSPELVQDVDAVISGEVRFTAEHLRRMERLTLIAHWGIGVDNVDLEAATESDIAVSNSPSAGNQASVAEAALTFLLALSKRLLDKDGLTRAGRAEAAQRLVGSLLRGRTVATIGLGATARLLVELLQPFRPARLLAHDPFVSAATAAACGVELVELDAAMREADYVVVMCSLTPETRGLIGAPLLDLMKPTACLVNTARGPIVDQRALTRALAERRIAGAALDVTDPEPPDPSDPLLALDNVIVTGHALVWTEESLSGACTEPCRAVASLYAGRPPEHVVNRDVLTRPGFQRKLARLSRSR